MVRGYRTPTMHTVHLLTLLSSIAIATGMPAPAPAAAGFSPGAELLGCFKDMQRSRVLTFGTSSDVMTNMVCGAYCSEASEYNAFYATQYGRECWCGEGDVDFDVHGPATCDIECAGDPSEICGGRFAFTLYEFDSWTPKPDPVEDPSALGCFKDKRRDRVLTAMTESDDMTPTVCALHCSDASESYAFYATQYGKECWCGGSDIDFDRHGPATCDIPCAGDSLLICGGSFAFTLYDLKPAPSPSPTFAPTSTPTEAPFSGPVCNLEVVNMSALVTGIGGATVTVASNCAIEKIVSIDDGPSGAILVAGEETAVPSGIFLGEEFDPTAVKFVTPPFVGNTTSGLVATVTLEEGGTVSTIIPVSSIIDLIGVTPQISVDGIDTGGPRAVLTDPPVDLELDWDPSLLSSDTVDIQLITLGDGVEEIEIVATLASGVSNDGLHVIAAVLLETIDLPEDSFVIFGITSSGSRRRLQEDDTLVFPEIITTTLMEWIASTPTDVSTCKELFDDDDSRCQCFFSIEQALDGGVPVTAFADEFRCPATINCALGTPKPEYLGPGLFEEWLATDLQDEWISDTTCPFVNCKWPNDGRWPDDDSAEEPTAVDLGTPSCHTRSWMSLFCNEQEGAAFCIRTSGAMGPDGLVNGHANQCCYSEEGDLIVDIAAGGGTIDRVESEWWAAAIAHFKQDVEPYNWCCAEDLESWQCGLYSEMRPTDAGDGHPTCTAEEPSGPIVKKNITTNVTLPEFPTRIDFGLLVDVSGSYSNDLVTLRRLAPELMEDLRLDDEGGARNLRLALGSYGDIPESPFGSSTDYPYRLDKAFKSCGADADPEACRADDRDEWVGAVNSLSASGGADGPESQSIALYSAATEWAWGDGVIKILAITTDARFHTPADDPRYYDVEEIIEECNTKNIKVLALKAPGAGTEMDQLANETGGSVQTTDRASSEIVEAILEGIIASSFSVVEVQWSCRDDVGDAAWQHDDSGAQTSVPGGSTVEFTLGVSVPSDLEVGVKCTALIVADEILVGGHEFEITDGMIVETSISAE